MPPATIEQIAVDYCGIAFSTTRPTAD